jgi:hypothetical protein
LKRTDDVGAAIVRAQKRVAAGQRGGAPAYILLSWAAPPGEEPDMHACTNYPAFARDDPAGYAKLLKNVPPHDIAWRYVDLLPKRFRPERPGVATDEPTEENDESTSPEY